MRLIDADEMSKRYTHDGISHPYDATDLDDMLAEMPTVDAVPRVSAHWRTLKDGSLECTNCFGIAPHDENYNGDIICNYETDYCPWCGAKMEADT